MGDPTLLATPPAAAAAPAATEPAKPAATAPAPAAEPAKTVIGEAPAKPPPEVAAAEKLYGKLVEKVVTDGEKKEAVKESAKEPAKAEAPKAEPAKPEAVKPGEKPAEIKYDLKIPQGSPLAQADVERLTSLVKEANVAPEVAEKLLAEEANTLKAYQDRMISDHAKTTQRWVEDLKADKEFGGEKFPETVESAKRAFHAYASPELVRLMNDTGYGNHPEVVKMFARIGKPMAEGRFVTGGQPVVGKKSAADVLYGDTTGKKKG